MDDSNSRDTTSARDGGRGVDALLCSLHRAATALHEDVEATRPPRQPSHIVDFSKLEARADSISAMRHLHAELLSLTAVVARYGLEAEALHREELASMRQYIDSSDTRARQGGASLGGASPSAAPANRGVPWKDEALTARVLQRAMRADGAMPTTAHREHLEVRAPSPTYAEPEPRAVAPARRGLKLRRRTVMLDDGVSLDAVIIPDSVGGSRDILAAVSSSELYYIPGWDHFAVRCGGVVFHGNIGTVYPAEGGRPPARVKECRHRARCPSLKGRKSPPCAYYHDPEECPGSRDVRNYLADSWVYMPATTRHSARYGSRRIGSREALREDLQEISAGDARRHVAQTAHDILCSIVLAKYVLGT